MNKVAKISGDICPVCQAALSNGQQNWHHICDECGYEKSDLYPVINLDTAHELINENAREAGLRKLRIHNFERILSNIKPLKPSGGRLLDVGCAHGWFLETAKNAFDVLGVEPDESVFERTARRGLPVRLGYFPQALDAAEQFDVIIFNDVIEHIPDIDNVLKDCRKHLKEDGLLVLNLPSSRGIFYRVAKRLCRIGFTGFFDRLWQKDLPSPHLHYFNASNIIKLLEKNSFLPQVKGSLSTLARPGLYTRISYTGNIGRIGSAFIYICALLSLPILKALPADIIYVVAKK